MYYNIISPPPSPRLHPNSYISAVLLQPVKLRPLEENPDPSPGIGLGKPPTSSWVSRAHSCMMEWLDVCLYCGSAGWGQQDCVPLVNNASGSQCNAVAPVVGGEAFVAGGGSGVQQQQQLQVQGHQQKHQQGHQQQVQLQPSPRLFCADCGECFHSWCTAAPVRTMDVKAVAAWRCPNCKVRACVLVWNWVRAIISG